MRYLVLLLYCLQYLLLLVLCHYWREIFFACFLNILLIYMFLNLLYSPVSSKVVYLFAFLSGLSLTHHPVTLFVIFPAIILLLVKNHKPKILMLKIFLYFSIGLLFYLYLPIRLNTGALSKWG